MAKYTSEFKELGFYVDGELKRFANGEYNTEDKAEIAVLDALKDAIKLAEDKPAKAPAKRKTTAKEA